MVRLKSYRVGPLDRDAIARGYDEWRSGQSGKKNAYRVREEYGSADALIDEIAGEIEGKTLSFRPIHRYRRVEPTNGKLRVIGVESVKQQVVDHALCLALAPLIDAKTGFYQTASVKGKGQRLCRGALRRWVHGNAYHVKLDVRQCYPSTSHDVVMGILRKYVRGDDALYVAQALLDTYDGGLEIGSYFALRMMQLVLSFAYHHVEGLGKARRGKWAPLVDHQIWHMDDALLLASDKRNLRMAVRSLERYLKREFGLTLKPWKIARTGDAEPLDLGGWVVRDGRCTLRAGVFLRARRAFRRFGRHPSPQNARRCSAYWGWLKAACCEGARSKYGIDRLMAYARKVIARQDRLDRNAYKNGCVA